MTYTIADALSLAAITRVELQRAKWLVFWREHAGALCYVDAMREFDLAADRALTQTLADAACDGVLMATRAEEKERA